VEDRRIHGSPPPKLVAYVSKNNLKRKCSGQGVEWIHFQPTPVAGNAPEDYYGFHIKFLYVHRPRACTFEHSTGEQLTHAQRWACSDPWTTYPHLPERPTCPSGAHCDKASVHMDGWSDPRCVMDVHQCFWVYSRRYRCVVCENESKKGADLQYSFFATNPHCLQQVRRAQPTTCVVLLCATRTDDDGLRVSASWRRTHPVFFTPWIWSPPKRRRCPRPSPSFSGTVWRPELPSSRFKTSWRTCTCNATTSAAMRSPLPCCNVARRPPSPPGRRTASVRSTTGTATLGVSRLQHTW
jgi:hypothetical protein